jgi:hypothetical protein
VAGQFDDFPGLRNYRAEENGAEWVTKKEQSLTRIARAPFDGDYKLLQDDDVFLRIWSPQFTHLDARLPVETTIKKIQRFSSAQIDRGNRDPVETPGLRFTFNLPVSLPDECAWERIYALPPDLVLEPQTQYRISGWIGDQGKNIRLFEINFYTNSRGRPAAF